ncbi:hypothetical protein [Nocardia sp. alder85J]|uniref:hypothetical protein n=1 Tax=Nocardia sp. alder85J TaxID=2862949 RepID=UPI0022516D9E|nr:hypothetical protein [Nocardia sp. alder85J]MCX4097524.1 hypothetical protein [Nocardia sp. alder85J]
MNSVTAAAAGDRERPAVRVRRTTVTFDSAGGPRMSTLPRFAPVVTDFADLTRDYEPLVLGGRIWRPADLVAAVATCLIEAGGPAVEPVATYPACYTDRQVFALRHALNWSGAGAAVLMPEPVAAVEWLDAEHGVSERGLTLVYDLGGGSLDVAIVRTEADREERGVLGRAVRSHTYGGRPLGVILARYARALAPGAPAPVSKVVPAVDTARLRSWHIRNSLRLVRTCVQANGIELTDVDRILVVGAAARPAEVAEALAELGPPLVLSPDPGHTVAVGAALASARMAGTGSELGRYARGAAVISGAAVASALAMSAASMIGNGPIGTDGPALEFAPALAGPADTASVYHQDASILDGLGSVSGAARKILASVTTARDYAVATRAVVAAATEEVERQVGSHGVGTHCDPVRTTPTWLYGDPARFTNPLPFAEATDPATPAVSSPATGLPGPAQGAPTAAAQHIANGSGTTAGNSAAAGTSNPPSGTTSAGGTVASSPGASAGGSSSTGTSGTGSGTTSGDSAGTGSGTAGSGTPAGTPNSGTPNGNSGASGAGTGGSGASSGAASGTAGSTAADGNSGGSAGSGASGGNSGGSGPGSSGNAGGAPGGGNAGGATAGGNSGGAPGGGNSGGSAGGGNSGGAPGGGNAGGATAGGNSGGAPGGGNSGGTASGGNSGGVPGGGAAGASSGGMGSGGSASGGAASGSRASDGGGLGSGAGAGAGGGHAGGGGHR